MVMDRDADISRSGMSRLTRRGFTLLASAALLLARAPAAAAAVRTGDIIGDLTYRITRHEETLLDIAREMSLGVPEISAVNPGVDPWLPGAETLVTLPTQFILPDAPRQGIVVNYGDLRLYYFPKSGPVQTYAIGIGREGFELKFGQTRIVRKKERPTWYPTADTQRDKPWVGKVVPPGPDNPLGEYALYLGWPTYLIHGTNKPFGVGRRVSRGCIRCYPEGIERLFRQVTVDTPVTCLNQSVKAGWHQGELYLEAQPDFAQIDELEANLTLTPKPAPEARQYIIGKAGPDAERIDWAVVEAELAMRRGIPVQITRPVDGLARGTTPSTATATTTAAADGDSTPAPIIVRRNVPSSGIY